MQCSVMDACAGYTRIQWHLGPLLHDPDFRCARFLGTAQPIIRRIVNEVTVNDEKLNAVLNFCYLGGMLCF